MGLCNTWGGMYTNWSLLMPVSIVKYINCIKNSISYPVLACLLEFLVNGAVAGHHNKHLDSHVTDGHWNHIRYIIPIWKDTGDKWVVHNIISLWYCRVNMRHISCSLYLEKFVLRICRAERMHQTHILENQNTSKAPCNHTLENC